jgi:phage regulator Rha-like protein
VTQEFFENMIYLVRGQKVMLDADLAELYGVETKYLKRQVRRNINRFPEDFMLRLSVSEAKFSRCQNVTLKRGQNVKYIPYVFTEQGVAMLSSVLNSERAININIAIMRAFVRIRHLIDSNKEFAQKLSQLERKYDRHDFQIQRIFDEFRKFDLPAFQEKNVKVKGFDKDGGR